MRNIKGKFIVGLIIVLMVNVMLPTTLIAKSDSMIIQDFNNLTNVNEGCWTKDVVSHGGSAQLIDDGKGGKALELTLPNPFKGIGPGIPFVISGDMFKANYIEFYIKGPGTSEPVNKPAHNFGVSFNININQKGIKDEWWRMSNSSDVASIADGVVGKFYTKAKGDTDWTTHDLTVGAGELVWISKNFEGLIRVPLDRFNYNYAEGYSDNSNFDRALINAASIWIIGASDTTRGVVVLDDFKAIGDFSDDEGGGEFSMPDNTPLYDTAVEVSKLARTESGKPYLWVDGKPFLMLGAQHRTDYFTQLDEKSLDELDEYFALARSLNITVVQVPVSWRDIEYKKDHYSSKNVRKYIELSEKYDMKLELLWFGSYMCGYSVKGYLPDYVVYDEVTYPSYRPEKALLRKWSNMETSSL